MTRARSSYITDFGTSILGLKDGDVAFEVERYGVWSWCPNKNKYLVVEVSGDLQALQEKYGPCDVFPIGQVDLSKNNDRNNA